MADTNNNNLNNNNNNNNNSVLTSDTPTTTFSKEDDVLAKLSEKILNTYKQLALERGIISYELTARPVSGVGENSYGLILQVCLRANETETDDNKENKEMISILKISPKNPAFRAHSRIADLYKREVFMYQEVINEFSNLQQERLMEMNGLENNNCDQKCDFNIVPDILYACLDLEDEFIIFEDLTLKGYKQNSRTQMPTYDLVTETFRSIAQFHAMSFVLQNKKPKLFENLVSEMSDNLFTHDMEPLSVEFGKKYIKKTRVMMEQDAKASKKQIDALQKLEDNFKQTCLECVNGNKAAPYAVLCHGDFWNNNILYKYNDHNQATSAKLIDFQLSRYASPILDLVHYLYTCTEKDLRNRHFMEFMEIYYQTLTHQIQFYGLQIEDIYPRTIFLQHLRDYGIFGFCMAAFSIPFFISNTSELPDYDEVASAIREISSTENSDEEMDAKEVVKEKSEATNKRLELLEEYDLLTERTLPIFKRRMCGIVRDLEKYEMMGNLLKL